MNHRQKAVLEQLLELLKDANGRFEACDLAAKFCPEPWSNNLREFSGVFMHHSQVIENSISELEAIFDDGGQDVTQNIETEQKHLAFDERVLCMFDPFDFVASGLDPQVLTIRKLAKNGAWFPVCQLLLWGDGNQDSFLPVFKVCISGHLPQFDSDLLP